MFRVRSVVITGNEHLTDDELKSMAGLSSDENLFRISSRRISSKLAESPWIRSVAVRKEFPDRLLIHISEAEPFALLDMKGKLFIVDDRGTMLEELRNIAVPFLPVISSNPYQEKEAFLEAITLAKAIKNTGLLSRKDHIEIISHKPQEMSVNIDGIVVKVGAGEYEDKLARLADIEQEIKQQEYFGRLYRPEICQQGAGQPCERGDQIMGGKLVVGLDVGSSKVCAVAAELNDRGVNILGVGEAPSKGLRKGIVINMEATVDSIKKAVAEAEASAGIRIKSVVAGISGVHINGLNSYGAVGIRGKEVRSFDRERAIDSAKAIYIPLDREVLHVLPTEFILDGQEGIIDPIGMAGVRLEAKVHIISGLASSVQNLMKCCEKAGLDVADIVFNPIAVCQRNAFKG